MNRVRGTLELISAGAVLVGLIFVGLELRQNTAAVEIASYQELTNNIISANLMLVDNPELLGLQLRAISDADSLSEVERRQIAIWVISRLRHADLAYFQFERGMIDKERLESVMAPLSATFRSQLAKDIWKVIKPNFVESFRSYMDEYISEIPDRPALADQNSE